MNKQNPFVTAMSTVSSADTTTENGMAAYSSSNSALVNLYYRMVRNISKIDLEVLLIKAWAENPLGTLKLVFQARDCRGGKGDRDSFKLALNWLSINHPEAVLANLHLIPEYGYWKDILLLFDSSNKTIADLALDLYVEALKKGNGLAFKYAPRPGKALQKYAKLLREKLELSEKQYRGFLKQGTTVVETQMCENLWDSIKYSGVPSKAHLNYKKAFKRHAETTYQAYLDAVETGKSNIKAGQLFPHELTKAYLQGQESNQTTNLQWAELVRKGKESGFLRKTLPIVDVSGSMASTQVAKGVSAMQISKSLGLYISEIVEEPWNNILINFSDEPKFFHLQGENLYQRVQELEVFEDGEGYSTNFIAVFKLILQKAKENELTQEQLPEMVIALSDMQFNVFESEGQGYNNPTAQEAIRKLYEDAGYTPPILVFWNLNGEYNNLPATSQQGNVVMLSGFSTSALKYLMERGVFTPEALLADIINSPRYAPIVLA